MSVDAIHLVHEHNTLTNENIRDILIVSPKEASLIVLKSQVNYLRTFIAKYCLKTDTANAAQQLIHVRSQHSKIR